MTDERGKIGSDGRHRRVLYLAVLFGAAIWLIDALLDYYVFYTGKGFWDILLLDPPEHEIYIRLVIFCLALAYGAYASHLLRRTELLNRSLADSLDQRELLLKEIHHRIKNNLQVVSSLISLQAGQAVRDEDREGLEKLGARVDSISLVHKHLYRTENLSDISLDRYLGELVEHLRNLFGPSRPEVEVLFESEPVHSDVKRAIPCGLIATELVQNAYTHAFAPDAGGRLEISLKANKGGFVLSVADDGPGLDASSDAEQGLGLTLIESLAEQIGADLVIHADNGTRAVLSVPGGQRT